MTEHGDGEVRGGYAESVPHYYGDYVRQLFISAAALMLIGAPFYSDALRVELPFEIAGALVLVALAALVNPHKQSVFLAAATASGVGLILFESWALYGYYDSTWTQFILREVIAIIFLAGFYFSMKTVRAFVLHKIGKHDTAGEFEEKSTSAKRNNTNTRRDEFTPWFLQSGGNHRKKDSEEKQAQDDTETGPQMSPGRSREEIKPKHHPYEDTM